MRAFKITLSVLLAVVRWPLGFVSELLFTIDLLIAGKTLDEIAEFQAGERKRYKEFVVGEKPLTIEEVERRIREVNRAKGEQK